MLTRRIALKRLAPVEVEPSASHQHELNADRLRSELGFPEGTTSGRLSIRYYDSEGADLDDGTFTVYDARERHVSRREYRLYYSSTLMSERARPGDLLLLFRDGPVEVLHCAVARKDSPAEAALLRAFRSGLKSDPRTFQFVEPPSTGDVLQLALELVQPQSDTSTSDDWINSARAMTVMPRGDDLARMAVDRAREHYSPATDPDLFIVTALDLESQLYFHLEGRLANERLRALTAEGKLDFASASELVLGYLQSRKSRRGRSLENHLRTVLIESAIPFQFHGRTEGKETPDFIIPSQQAYDDPGYPADRLRIVACKTTARDRWRQILNEAARVERKYLLTVDSDLTDESVEAMDKADLQIYMPAGLIESRYSGRAARPHLRSIRQLVEDLLVAVAG